MKGLNLYGLFLIALLSACEDIYSPEINAVDNVMVVDARIVNGSSENYIQLKESHGYNDAKESYPGITGASVTLISSNGEKTNLDESAQGKFLLKGELNPDLNYKLKIDYQGESFESTFESVPQVPEIDTLYGITEDKTIRIDGDNDVINYWKKTGVQLYADILNENESPYFRFTARKILQYIYYVKVPFMGDTVYHPMYAWYSYYPQDFFNIAAPPEYSVSTNIKEHPLYFLEQKITRGESQTFAGWILILNQFGLSKTSYKYYKDLNNQLLAEGRLFDPVYVQARNNLKCTTNPKLFILGNFEISAATETRYFVKYISEKAGYYIKEIPYFYQIPESGEQLNFTPDFWEHNNKTYPNE